MKPAYSPSSAIATFLSLLFIFIFLTAFSPTKWGGAVTYVIVDGNSMEPRFHLGDLVLVRKESAYEVGDAVVYRNEEMHRFVFHRIIATELDHFVMQGDHNSWLDSYQPSDGDVIGKLWIHIPKVGKAVEWVRAPLHLSLIIGLLGGILMFDLFGGSSPRKKRRKLHMPDLGRLSEGAFYGFGFLALLFLVVGIYSFFLPLNHPIEKITYQQEGDYLYSAMGAPGVYDTNMVRAGEPIFPKLTCFVNINFAYTLISDRLQGISGNYRMYARVVDKQSGWQRTMPLNNQTPFNGNSYSTTSTLDLCQVAAFVNLVEQQAGLKQLVYNVEIITNVVFTASVDEVPITDSFSPSLVFKYDKIHFYLADDGGQTDPLRSTKAGLASSSNSRPNMISIVGLKFPVRTVRFLFGLGFAISLLGFVLVGIKVYRPTSSEERVIRWRYSSLLVDIEKQSIAPSSSIMEVTTIGDLVRLAERHDTVILHATRNLLHYYLVQTIGTTYCYIGSGNKNSPSQSKFPSDEKGERAKLMKQKPVLVHPPLSIESPPHKADKPEDPTTTVAMRQRHGTYANTGLTYADEKKISMAETIPGEMTKYFIDIDRIKDANRFLAGSTHYVMDTGAIEAVLQRQETKVLRKAKLQICDSRFAS